MHYDIGALPFVLTVAGLLLAYVMRLDYLAAKRRKTK